MAKGANLLLIACLFGICLVSLHWIQRADSKEVHDENKIKAIKDHVDEIKHILDKRAALKDGEHSQKGSPTTTTTTSSTTTSTTTHKPRSRNRTSTTKKSRAKSDSKSAKPERPGRSDSEATTTIGPHDRTVSHFEEEATRERERLIDQEDLALSYAIAGIDSWLRAFARLGETHSATKLGEFLYKFEAKVKHIIGPEKMRRYMDDFLDIYAQHLVDKRRERLAKDAEAPMANRVRVSEGRDSRDTDADEDREDERDSSE